MNENINLGFLGIKGHQIHDQLKENSIFKLKAFGALDSELHLSYRNWPSRKLKR